MCRGCRHTDFTPETRKNAKFSLKNDSGHGVGRELSSTAKYGSGTSYRVARTFVKTSNFYILYIPPNVILGYDLGLGLGVQ